MVAGARAHLPELGRRIATLAGRAQRLGTGPIAEHRTGERRRALACVCVAWKMCGRLGVAAVTTPHDPSFTSHGVAFVPTSASNGVILPLTGANSSGLVNHGMTLSGTHSVAVPTAGIYNLTLAGNCNGGATGTYLKIVEGNGLPGNKLDLALAFEGNPSLAGATTVHLAAGTALNMVAGHTGADVNCGATLGATLVSADA